MLEIVFVDDGENVFAQTGMPEPEIELMRTRLGVALRRIIAASGLTQAPVAERLGTRQPRISRLMGGHFDEFNVESLDRYLNRLGYRLKVGAEPKSVTADAD